MAHENRSQAGYGWESLFPEFRDTPSQDIRHRLLDFLREVNDVTQEQIRAWDDSIPPLQHEVGEVLSRDRAAARFAAILEYELPLESRRPDVVLLLAGGVAVIELKGKNKPSLADIDQAAAYARDLSCYHSECEDVTVTPVLVPTHARGDLGSRHGVRVVGPDYLDAVITELSKPAAAAILRERFLSEDAYRPLPTIVEAARELFETRELRYIKRARAATDPAVRRLAEIVREAAETETRRLVLVTGIPGAGKTLVGLQLVHSRFLDDFVRPRLAGRSTAPAVFLSGNRPLVAVLQYQLKGAGGGGKTFVRHVFDYVKAHSRGRVPSEHVLVFDEAQRAFDASQVDAKHRKSEGRSEPELFVEFAGRIPNWCVVVGLVGGGQEIHVGEEGGLTLWQSAIARSSQCHAWIVHAPPDAARHFTGDSTCHVEPSLNLDVELRQHRARHLHKFVEGLLDVAPTARLAPLAAQLSSETFQLRLSRDLSIAKQYLHDRFSGDPLARYGLLASSRDKDLGRFGIPNDYRSTSNVHAGPWYSEPEGSRSCRTLRTCATEFGSQGLELDGVLLAWGTDLLLSDGQWSTARSRRYRNATAVKDAKQLRLNAYRVLLTRARDVCVVFVPPIPELNETFEYLEASGFLRIDAIEP